MKIALNNGMTLNVDEFSIRLPIGVQLELLGQAVLMAGLALFAAVVLAPYMPFSGAEILGGFGLLMAVQFSTDVRNARLDAIETTIGTTPILKMRTGAQPANCAAADTGTVVATINMPSDWMDAASGGIKGKAGTWADSSADADGDAAHFRIYDSGGSTCKMQGSVTVTGGGGDMTVDNVDFNPGQPFTVTGFNITDGNP